MVASLRFIKDVTGSGALSQIDVTNVFSDEYNKYYFVINHGTSQGDTYMNMRFLDSTGTVISDSEYAYAGYQFRDYASFNKLSEASENHLRIGFAGTASSDPRSGAWTFEVTNPYNTDKFTYQISDGSVNFSLGQVGNNMVGVHKVEERITGVRVYPNTGTFTNLTIHCYGII